MHAFALVHCHRPARSHCHRPPIAAVVLVPVVPVARFVSAVKVGKINSCDCVTIFDLLLPGTAPPVATLLYLLVLYIIFLLCLLSLIHDHRLTSDSWKVEVQQEKKRIVPLLSFSDSTIHSTARDVPRHRSHQVTKQAPTQKDNKSILEHTHTHARSLADKQNRLA